MSDTPNSLINTITVGTSIKGDIQANGDFRMDGTLEGNITLTGKLVIGEQGHIVGNVVCQNANVIGIIDGLLLVITSQRRYRCQQTGHRTRRLFHWQLPHARRTLRLTEHSLCQKRKTSDNYLRLGREYHLSSCLPLVRMAALVNIGEWPPTTIVVLPHGTTM